MENAPKITKALLSSVVRQAKQIYIDRANTADSRYLDAGEVIARAYVEAYQNYLEQHGYTIQPKPSAD